ncbi:MAG: hypothetical protein HUJ86_06265 [Synergistes sp.]|nr:hypothetical protein [Synergistes sp.]
MRYRDTISPGVRLPLFTKGGVMIKAILSDDKKAAADICGCTGGYSNDRA